MRLAHVEARLEQQLTLNTLITSSYDDLTKVSLHNLNYQRIQARLTALKDDWEKFFIIHEAIGIALRELNHEDRLYIQNHSYFSENFFVTTRELYLESTERMSLLLDSDHGAMSGTSSGHLDVPIPPGPSYHHHARLPRIDIPKFSGNPEDWLSFKDLFTSLVIANGSLSSVEKLQYLKTSLVGTAAQLLRNMSVTGENFQRAWDALIAFYENKRMLLNTTLNSLLSLKRMTKESAGELERLYTCMMQIYRSLENLQRPVSHWNDFLIFIAVQRLDSETVKTWEQLLGSTKDPPKWHQFTEFLLSRLRSLQAFEKATFGKLSTQPQKISVKTHYQGTSRKEDPNTEKTCPLCSDNRHPSLCTVYNTKSVPQRRLLIYKHKLCFNCLGRHRVAACQVSKRCRKCGQKHHTTIHSVSSHQDKNKENSKDTTNSEEKSNAISQERKVMHSILLPSIKVQRVLLATAQVQVTAPNGNMTEVRALIDQGSEISLISERTVQRLKMTRKHSSVSLIGIGGKTPNSPRGMVNFKLSPHFQSEFQCTVTAHILANLTSEIPSAQLDPTTWPHLTDLKLADVQYMQPGAIDLILGADVYGYIIADGLVKGPPDSPIAQSTKLGWVISGPTEEIPTLKDHSVTPDEQRCEEHFQLTHTRDPQGRYVVWLPFKQSTDQLGSSKAKAIRIIHQLNRRFESDPCYAKLYSDFVVEYAALQHMTLIPDSQSDSTSSYYLPHHGIIKENSSTTKLRVVFNGSSKTTTGVSLNDLLHVGPKLQTDIFDVLIWYRQFRYVFSADVEKMYRQIKVHPEDWKYQQISWIDHEGRLLTYQLTTVTYGLACAPFQALRVMQQLIKDEGARLPLAVPVLSQGRYVDDLFGGDSIIQAQDTLKQVNQLCMAGGFKLRKWISNDPTVLKSVPEKDRMIGSSVSIEEKSVVLSLGLHWHLDNDTFQFTFHHKHTETITKRSILATIARLFDPLGLLSPLMIRAKMLMQEVWSLQLGWDDPVPSAITCKWMSFVSDLQNLATISFPRWIGLSSDRILEIHGFSDASPYAFAAVVYTRLTSNDGSIHTKLICSKTKVAPLKRMTIPRLELAGAVLLTKLVNHIIKVLNRNYIPVYLWTDSTVSLTWISNHPSRWKDFVHNRVCYIQETVPQAQWNFVAGRENPADLATRGLSIDQLVEKKCWITVICRRVIDKLRKVPNSSLLHPITTIELQSAKHFWIKAVQHTAFPRELKSISEGKHFQPSHPFSRLTPFMDANDILRVGGRLRESSLSMEAKHPAILPKCSPFTTLIIADVHRRTLHGGTQIMLSTLREEFWVIGGRVPIKSFILKCVQCTRFRHKRAQQLMGQLPKERVSQTRPFLNTGVDYAGPLSIKTWRGRNARTYKAYVALFLIRDSQGGEVSAQLFGVTVALTSRAQMLPCKSYSLKPHPNLSTSLLYWQITAHSGSLFLHPLHTSVVNGRQVSNL
ncbi:PREDICTED: uncharacterized protein LOC108770524 [Trachymyrmex cornetzi]|uniref:uncharacterized protein LOC108770524 n=1 Tax=Trachymyrmex cornetzi TaxID=471704 RepID=UPI00084F286A|nr:PREDICTED: uncharacterized protein LOC108770524 [Trachymyrmex cornetzi]